VGNLGDGSVRGYEQLAGAPQAGDPKQAHRSLSDRLREKPVNPVTSEAAVAQLGKFAYVTSVIRDRWSGAKYTLLQAVHPASQTFTSLLFRSVIHTMAVRLLDRFVNIATLIKTVGGIGTESARAPVAIGALLVH
jgi:hypothetical protein